MHIREAGPDDLALLTRLRLEFLAEHRGVEPAGFPAAFEAATSAFLRGHAEAGTGRSWFAQRHGVDVGVVTMLVRDLPPRPDDLAAREGYLVNMYVVPAHRRQGAARALLRACRDAAAELRLRRLVLYATDDGRPLYAGAGFRPDPTWMELLL